jgi:tetratricopeptide (TPR) repeat protein
VSRADVPRQAKKTSAREELPRIDREGGAVGLRLAIGRDGLGIELARTATIECLDVVELVVRLPHVRFPFDVSGGVARFRNRRGELERLAVEIDARRAARWAEARVRGIIGAAPCALTIALRAYGATITMSVRENERVAALAFELAMVPVRDDLVLVVHGARGAGLPDAPTVLAIRTMEALLSGAARREGARFVIARAGERIARRLLPDAGVRAPGGDDVTLFGCGESDGVVFAMFVRTDSPMPNDARWRASAVTPPEEATRAAETAWLLREGDDARAAGDHDRARACDVAVLERAPRHPDLAVRIAELDARRGERAEAAVTMLREAQGERRCGALLGELLVETGDVAGAIAALAREGENESSPVVAALVLARAASLTVDPHDALRFLDAAIARAPRIPELRWERAKRRLAVGRIADARADFQALEALAEGPRERHGVLRRAGDAYRDVGLGNEAAAQYERALLYRPEDASTLAGMGVALANEDRAPRGAALVAHAVDLASARGEKTSWMELALARILGDRVGDRPGAVARLRAIRDDAPEALDARGLEGRYRAELGDIAGATIAFARMRERASLTRDRDSVGWLLEAARFESETRGDLAAAQRHLAAAIAIRPNDPAVTEPYRAIGARIAEVHGVREVVAMPAMEKTKEWPTVGQSGAWPSESHTRPWDGLAEIAEQDDAESEARVEQLTRSLQADPTNDAVVDELATLLTQLDRGMELLALLSARLEDATPERRAALLPRHRQVLARLEREARAAGREAEADLFRIARESS